MRQHSMSYEHNFGSSTGSISSKALGLSEPHRQLTLSIADRHVLRHRLATMRAEADALIRMLDKQDHKTIDRELVEKLVLRWSDLLDVALNPR